MTTYGTGYIESPIDKRDLLLEAFLPLITLPRHVDYSSTDIPVKNQGPEGTCVGFSCTTMKEFQEFKEHNRYIQLSPRYLYQKCKEIDGSPNEEGTYPHVAVMILLKNGICEESYQPYVPHQPGQPKPGAEQNAQHYRIQAFGHLTTVQGMKRSLVLNGPFVVGVRLHGPDWFQAPNGVIPMPSQDPRSGHAICIVGYDQDRSVFKFQNSWDRGWGDQGCGYLPYAYIEQYCIEAYSATDLIEDPRAHVELKEKILQQLGEEFVVARDQAESLGIH